MSYLDIARAALARHHGLPQAVTLNPPSLPALLALSLPAFEQARVTLEIRASFLDVTLFFASSSCEVDVLLREGVSRGRIWTARELQDVLQVPSNYVPTVARAKALWGGEVVAVLPREGSELSEGSPWGISGAESRSELSEESEGRATRRGEGAT